MRLQRPGDGGLRIAVVALVVSLVSLALVPGLVHRSEQLGDVRAPRLMGGQGTRPGPSRGQRSARPRVVGSTPVAAPSASIGATDFRSRVEQELGADRADVAVAVRDRRTGAVVTVGFTEPVETASTVKVLIAIAVLEHSWAAGGPDDETSELLWSMITASDNEATSLLYESLGDDPLAPLFVRLGIQTPSPGEVWGLTRLTAADQLLVLDSLTSSTSPWDPRTRSEVLHLMENVVDDQAWGITAGVGEQDVVALKNGWLPLDDGMPDDVPPDEETPDAPPVEPGPETDWVVHSIGVVAGSGRDYQIVVLTRHDEDAQVGVARIERVSRVVYDLLASSLIR